MTWKTLPVQCPMPGFSRTCATDLSGWIPEEMALKPVCTCVWPKLKDMSGYAHKTPEFLFEDNVRHRARSIAKCLRTPTISIQRLHGRNTRLVVAVPLVEARTQEARGDQGRNPRRSLRQGPAR